MKGVATRKPLQPHPDAGQRSVSAYGLGHIFGTRGIVTAGRRQQGRYPAFIGGQSSQDHLLHRSSTRSTSLSKTSCGTSYAARRTFHTIRHPGPSRASRRRTVSLNRRRIRFRLTALPRARGEVKPTLAPSSDCGASGAFQQKATHVRQITLKPRSYTLRNSAGRSKRLALGKRWIRGGNSGFN